VALSKQWNQHKVRLNEVEGHVALKAAMCCGFGLFDYGVNKVIIT